MVKIKKEGVLHKGKPCKPGTLLSLDAESETRLVREGYCTFVEAWTGSKGDDHPNEPAAKSKPEQPAEGAETEPEQPAEDAETESEQPAEDTEEEDGPETEMPEESSNSSKSKRTSRKK